jgi:hypothetical protein
VVPLSQHDELHPLRDEHGNWTGVLNNTDLQKVPLVTAGDTAGPAGTITVHNARCVHGSQPNTTATPRPLLLNTFTAASAHMIARAGTNLLHAKTPRGGRVVRGSDTCLAVLDGRPIPMAPDFSEGYKSPFFAEKKALTDG